MSGYRRKTKIICTLGPAVASKRKIEKLIEAGMNIARLNFSHGDYAQHRKMYKLVRKASEKLNKPVGILQDLEGHRIRVRSFKDKQSISLKQGQKLRISSSKKLGDDNLITVSYKGFESVLKKGHRIYIDDGNISLKIVSKKKNYLEAEVISGGKLMPNKGINVPEANLKFPDISQKDKEDLEFGLKLGVDYVAQSFVRYPKDIITVKNIMKRKKRNIPVIAKIEDPKGLENIDKIIDVSDGIIVARGDLGVSMPLEKVPILQKEIIHTCNRSGKPVITATQMLDSMTHNKRPTRAEVTDVANAIIDGTDLAMLSGETAMGKYPSASVNYMDRIIVNTEKCLDYNKLLNRREIYPNDHVSEAVAYSVRSFAQLIDLNAIIIHTRSGLTAEMVAKFRPYDPIIAVTEDKKAIYKLLLYWGVTPVLLQKKIRSPEDIFKILLKKKVIKKSKLVLFTRAINPKGKKFGSFEVFRV
jgi:pyruvate kinase